MTILTSKVHRETLGQVRENGHNRPVIVTLAPPNLIGFRAKGCRSTYWLTVEAGYAMAVKAESMASQPEKSKVKRY